MSHTFYIAAFYDDKRIEGPFAQLFTEDVQALDGFAKEHDGRGVSVYQCVGRLQPNARRRLLTTVAAIEIIHSDIDLRALVTPQETVLETLRRLAQTLPFEIRESGGGYHVVVILKEPADVGTAEYDRAVALRTALTEMLCGDPAPNHSAALLRCLGTHNSKWGEPRLCRVIQPGVPVDITDVEAFIELYAGRPQFEWLPKPKTNGHDSNSDGERRRFDREERIAELRYPGNIHEYELHCTASLIATGTELEIAVQDTLDDVHSYIDAHPPPKPWNWDRERRRIVRMSYSWINKKPELAPALPNALYAEHDRILRGGGAPWAYWDRSRKGWWVKSKTPIAEDAQAPLNGWQLYDTAKRVPMRWTIKGILMELGTTILSGQWGTFKTTVVLALSLSIMTGIRFAGRYRVKRRGGVIYFAVEGYGGIPYRLEALAKELGVDGGLPFIYRPDCPPLKDKKSAALVNNLVDMAATELKRTYGVDAALIVFDTWARTSGIRSKGDNDDVGVTAGVIDTLDAVSDHAGCVCLAVDHMGKDVERGTIGSSGKEYIDGLLATLGDRSVSGPITNTRLVVRKVKDGLAGFEIPFSPRVIETGVDEDGDAETAVLLDWGLPQDCQVRPARKKGSAETLLLSCLDAVIAAEGKPLERRDGSVMAAPAERVREKFFSDFRTKEGSTPEQGQDAKKKAFNRAMIKSQPIVGHRTVNGIEWLWRVPGRD